MERSLRKSRIFADAVFIIALTNRRDQYHKRALELSQQYEGHSLVVTDAVLLEVGNTLARNHKQEAIGAIERLLASDDVEVVHLTQQLFEQGFDLYRSYHDKAWGLIDCISFVVMREAGISLALTHDRHFEQAGFQVLMQEETH